MSDKLNLQDLIDLLVERHSMNKQDAESFVRGFFDLIEESLEKDKYVKIKGLGTFKLINVESRESININTGERFEIEGHTKISFTPEAMLKEAVNKPFAHFESVQLNDNVFFDDMTVADNGATLDEGENELKQEIILPAEGSDDVENERGGQKGDIFEKQETEKKSELKEEGVQHISEKEEPIAEENVGFFENEEGDSEPEMIANDPTVSLKRETNFIKYFVGVALVIVLACIVGIALMYWPDLMKKEERSINLGQTHDVIVQKQDSDNVVPDTTKATLWVETKAGSSDTIAKTIEKTVEKKEHDGAVLKSRESVAQKERKNVSVKTKAVFTSDSVGYDIIGTETTYTLKEGETLTKVALRFYGTKALWPYLVKHNSDLIKNPDNVPSGVTIKIPKLEKKAVK